jgi:hypothetical protein
MLGNVLKGKVRLIRVTNFPFLEAGFVFNFLFDEESRLTALG